MSEKTKTTKYGELLPVTSWLSEVQTEQRKTQWSGQAVGAPGVASNFTEFDRFGIGHHIITQHSS
ncbi:MAG: hypothetical protein K1Y36_16320 [Blastocatellia bacterium]|nr:hypothetical protein [Blastocatellia bacterium]